MKENGLQRHLPPKNSTKHYFIHIWTNRNFRSTLTVSPSMQTVKGRIRMYHPAQNPATGKEINIRIRNQIMLQRILPDAAIFELQNGIVFT